MTLILPNGRPASYHPDDVEKAVNITFPVPWCPVCGHEVDKFEVVEDPASDKITFVAHCHGDTDYITSYKESLAALKLELFTQASRFTNKGRVVHKFFNKRDETII